MVEFPYTVHIKGAKGNFTPALGPQFYDEDKKIKRKKPFGFCTNHFCFGRPDVCVSGRHFVQGLMGFSYKVTEDNSINSCPSCDYAIYWSQDYEWLTNKDCAIKRIRTIGELYLAIKNKG